MVVTFRNVSACHVIAKMTTFLRVIDRKPTILYQQGFLLELKGGGLRTQVTLSLSVSGVLLLFQCHSPFSS